MCDFTTGFKPPEMVKKRPVVVVATGSRHNTKLVTVVPLSTTAPSPVRDYHCTIDGKHLPKTSLFFGKQSWVKGDMVCTVGFARLDGIVVGRDLAGKREYFRERLGREVMTQIYACVLNGLNLGRLVQHL